MSVEGALSRGILHRAAAIIGVGHTNWVGDAERTKRGEKPHTGIGYAALAFLDALADAGLSQNDIDGLIVGPTVPYERMGEILGINPSWSGQADSGGAILQACMAIATGMAETIALVYGNDQRSAKVEYGGQNAASATNYLAYAYHAPWGMTSQGAIYALMARRYEALGGLTEAGLAQVSVALRASAMLNPNALLRNPLTVEEYMAQPYVCEPLRRPDYCLINDGGVALIITSAERARRVGNKAVHVHGIGRSDLNTDASSLQGRLTDFYYEGQRKAAAASFDMAGVGPSDIDVIQIYDSFSLHVPLALEGYGYCRRGDIARYLTEQGIGLSSSRPVNTSGGHLAESYMQGWNHQVEAIRQIRGACGARQVEGCRFVHYSADVAGKCVSIVYGPGD
ncbi:thiolase family protein [Chelativorans sp. Marseille-P2723]|uniref:thiolase family protein n=1 Tax=Chelativorans sp. Marseille-P2723 TaxID=2709133 RepID=UPI00156F5E52|nr:thiolase family protein [Chelativorans sp. Marseille-P2723]